MCIWGTISKLSSRQTYLRFKQFWKTEEGGIVVENSKLDFRSIYSEHLLFGLEIKEWGHIILWLLCKVFWKFWYWKSILSDINIPLIMIRWKFGWHSWNVNGSWSFQMWQYCMFSLREPIVIHTCMISQKSPQSKVWHSYWCKIIYFLLIMFRYCYKCIV